MGWFWADTPSTSSRPRLAQGRPGGSPSQCPMNRPRSPPPAQPSPSSAPPSCPVQISPPSQPPPSCPVSTTTAPPPQHDSPSSTLSKLNPLNYMPSNLSQRRAPSQSHPLPLDREVSSIPRGDQDSNWEYPSPQQMYNAMLRKGYDDTPADAVESMVAVHNFLNEGAWAEIEGWERRFSRGLGFGWRACQRGEAAFDATAMEDRGATAPRLVRFQGRPGEMTPKARMLQVLGWMYPSKFGSEPPFDRHDWYVQRSPPGEQTHEVRYVIDYYSAPPEPTGEPVFYLDVRPAVDSPSAAAERLMRWGGEFWWKASGATARER